MANYNSITLDEILAVIENAAIHIDKPQTIKSTRGSVATVEWQTWRSKDGKYHSLLCVDYDCGYKSYDMEKSDRIEVVEAILIALNCHLKINKEYKWLFRDIIRVNNPKHPLYGHIVDMASGEVII